MRIFLLGIVAVVLSTRFCFGICISKNQTNAGGAEFCFAESVQKSGPRTRWLQTSRRVHEVIR